MFRVENQCLTIINRFPTIDLIMSWLITDSLYSFNSTLLSSGKKRKNFVQTSLRLNSTIKLTLSTFTHSILYATDVRSFEQYGAELHK